MRRSVTTLATLALFGGLTLVGGPAFAGHRGQTYHYSGAGCGYWTAAGYANCNTGYAPSTPQYAPRPAYYAPQSAYPQYQQATYATPAPAAAYAPTQSPWPQR